MSQHVLPDRLESVLGPDGILLADCSICTPTPEAASLERCRANARLIAAAPELLEAARGIVDGIDDTRPNFIPLMGNRVAHLREAIAKAEGGAS